MTQYRSNGKASEPKEHNPELDLSIGQVLAATGATTIGTILIKFLDLWGTTLGTAALSVCTSIGAVLLLRTMRRTSERFKTQLSTLSPAARADQQQTVELLDNPSRVTATAPIPTVTGDGQAKVLNAAEPIGEGEYLPKNTHRRRTLLTILASSVLVFGLTMGVLFLLGGASGDPGLFLRQPAPDETTPTIVEEFEPETNDSDQVEPTGPTEAPTTSGDSSREPQGEQSDEAPTEADPTPEEPSAEPSPEPTVEPDEGMGGTEADPTPPPPPPTD